jgi:hypothetical protein
MPQGPMTRSPLLEFLTRKATEARMQTVPTMQATPPLTQLKDAILERLQSLGEQPVAQVAGAVMGNPATQTAGRAFQMGIQGNTMDDPNWKSAAAVIPRLTTGRMSPFDVFLKDGSKKRTFAESAGLARMKAESHGLSVSDVKPALPLEQAVAALPKNTKR